MNVFFSKIHTRILTFQSPSQTKELVVIISKPSPQTNRWLTVARSASASVELSSVMLSATALMAVTLVCVLLSRYSLHTTGDVGLPVDPTQTVRLIRSAASTNVVGKRAQHQKVCLLLFLSTMILLCLFTKNVYYPRTVSQSY